MAFANTQLDAYRIFVNLTAGWMDITSYVVSDIACGWGNQSPDTLDFVANTGTMTLTLNNNTGEFSPGPAAFGGWKKGVEIKLVMTFESVEYVRWNGVIDTIAFAGPSRRAQQYVTVTCVDWMEYAANTPIVNPGVQSNKRGDEVITTIIGLMPIPPLATSLAVGENTFPTVLDLKTSKTKAMTEFGKVAFSECGHIYLTKDRLYGETLVFESATRRSGILPLSSFPYDNVTSGYLLKEDGGYLLKEDGGKIALDVVNTSFVVNNAMYDLEASYGDNLLNYLTTQVFPRRVDAAAVILFQLDKPIQIGSGATVVIEGTYANPSGGSQVSGQSMVAPVATTDYLGNTLENGTGANITASITVTPTYGSSGFKHSVYNASATSGWITKFNCRGIGVYVYNPVQKTASDLTSIGEYGHYTKWLNQPYQNTTVTGEIFAKGVVEQEQQPRTRLLRIDLHANKSPEIMMAFLNLDCGSLIQVKENKGGTDRHYFIVAVSFMIMVGGLITCSWFLKERQSLSSGALWPLAVEFTGGASKNAIDFGYLPRVSSLPLRTFSAWIWIDSSYSTVNVIMGVFSDAAGCIFYESGASIVVYQKGATTPGAWGTAANQVPLNQWVHVVATRDSSVAANAAVLYVNGVSKAVSVLLTQTGATVPEVGNSFMIGNYKTVTRDYDKPFVGQIKDARVYDRILTAAEVTSLAAGGVVTNGLVFQGPNIPAERFGYYYDHSLTSDMHVIDNIYWAIGVPNAAPVGRAP